MVVVVVVCVPSNEYGHSSNEQNDLEGKSECRERLLLIIPITWYFIVVKLKWEIINIFVSSGMFFLSRSLRAFILFQQLPNGMGYDSMEMVFKIISFM